METGGEKRRYYVVLGAIGLALAVLVGGGVWVFLGRDDPGRSASALATPTATPTAGPSSTAVLTGQAPASTADGTPTGWVNGYSGYFADPDGYRWEIAYNPEQALMAIVLPD
ncbi:MAG: Glyoxalase [Marmoricola sp.]|nr:Glyoxalase [Marmoricola sp.]